MATTRLSRNFRRVLSLLALLGFAVASAPAQTTAVRPNVTVLAYNVDNLFDATPDGTEYPEYRPRQGGWTDRLYRERLANTAKVIRESTAGGPDIVVLEEVENPAVLQTLANRYLKQLGYGSYVMVPVAGSAINVGILTRFAVTSVRAHKVLADTRHPLRNILEVTLDVRGVPLTLFACHWKAKSGGSQVTEEGRRIASHIIITRMQALLRARPDAEVMVVGDLNESVNEYERTGGQYQTALIDLDGTTLSPELAGSYAHDSIFVVDKPDEMHMVPEALVLYSPWGTVPPGTGSYWYRGTWETIDQFLLGPGLVDRRGLSFTGFQVVDKGYLINRLGHPAAWRTSAGSGYSDHLPILLTLSIIPAN